MTASLTVAHTCDLDAAALGAVRDLLDGSFGGRLDDDDWEHCLGGMHALLHEGPELVGHASVVQRRLLHGGRALRAGYVEGVAVRPDRRRRGYATALMVAIHRVVRGGYDLGALSPTEEAVPLYAGLGWQIWRGPTRVLAPDGPRRTPDDDGGVLVLPAVPPAVPLDLDGDLACDWRDGDVW